MAEQNTAKLHERLDVIAATRPEVYHFALAFLIGAARVNSDLRDSIESAVDYVERMVNRD